MKAIVALSFLLVGSSLSVAQKCAECVEVAKGKIPPHHLARTLKKLPSDIVIWDAPEAIAALKAETGVLWVDTRPRSFGKIGTVRGAVTLVTDLLGQAIPDADKPKELTKERLQKEIDARGGIGSIKVAFFCQGPECHRSYNAAIRAVKEYGLPPSAIIWFRDGYPGLLDYINADPKLKARISRYLEGDVLNQ